MYPDPQNSKEIPLTPKEAFWTEKNGAGLALLKHDDVIASGDAGKTVLDFFSSFYDEGMKRMDCDLRNKTYKFKV
jgi:hypothetical protein